MKRYYYTDPLAASWMAKHFGMILTTKDGLQVINVVCGMASWIDGEGAIYHQPPCYIHPDSLAILEPMENDIGKDGEGNLMVFLDGRWRDWGDDEWVLNKPHTIIQRNGIAFHWPEVEE